jgi:pSer/pThr/pTyr-binding forkhead associated (FHA) protein
MIHIQCWIALVIFGILWWQETSLMTANLKVVRWQIGQDAIPLDRTPLRLGRNPAQNDIALPSGDQRISRQHLHLIEEFGRWVLVDHSRNGVYVNDELVRGTRRELQHGDHITIGDSVEFVFDDPNSTFPVKLRTAEPAVGIHLDPKALTVWRDGLVIEVEWSPQEFALLSFLYERRGQLCRYEEIIGAVWSSGDPTYGREHVHELVARVRRKLEPNPSEPVYLVTHKGHGYMLT